MDNKSEKTTGSRRDVLKMLGLGAPAMAATVVATGSTAAAKEAPSSLGLRKTAHVEKYLETARF
ncbi:MAG: hypothetical protein AAFO79_02235 [Pseudomonadota bacterium]